MKKKYLPAIAIAFFGVALVLGGCATAYLGFHGKTVKKFPDIHSGITGDTQCLECHHPDHAQGPVTPHPNFTGCLKCHND